MSLTRRQLLVRAGVGRPGSAREARSRRSGWARSTRRRPFDRSEFPEPGRAAVAVLRAASYDGDLEGLLLDGLRLVEPDVRGRSVLLKPNLVEYAAGSVDQHRPAARRRRREHACAGWARPRSSWPKAPGTAGTPRP